MDRYNFKSIEEKWQKTWDEKKTFSTKVNKNKKKFYCLEMFPYPSGKIHMGHVRNYVIGDVVARYKRSNGFNVLHPMGWDAFGMPAENAAIKNNVHPRDWTYQNIEEMRFQLKQLGLSYDWEREIKTCDKDYYIHEQRFFLDLLKNNLAYKKESYVNWDPVDNTVLANEQVIDGKGWRSGAEVIQKKLSQWFLKITDFAEDLIENLNQLEGWPKKVLSMQENWIGKSIGAEINFYTDENEEIKVFTTRPDTIFGASFIGLSPDHEISKKLSESNKEIKKFIESCKKNSSTTEALEKAEKIGIDIETKNRNFDANKIMQRFYCNDEINELKLIKNKDKLRIAVMKLWLLKESSIKLQHGTIASDLLNWQININEKIAFNKIAKLKLHSYCFEYKDWYIGTVSQNIKIKELETIICDMF